MRAPRVVITLVMILHHTTAWHSFLDETVTVGDVERFKRHLVDDARHQFSKIFSEEMSVFRQGLDLKSVGLKQTDGLTEVVVDGSLEGLEASINDLQRVYNTNRSLALTSSDESGVVLVEIAVRRNTSTLVVRVLTTLRPKGEDFVSICSSFLWAGTLFYSTLTRTGDGLRRVIVDAIDLETLTPMNIDYWVDVHSDQPLMHFFELADNLYFVVDSRLYVYNLKAMYIDRLDHEMLDSVFGTSITGFRDTAGYYIVVGMRDNVESPVYVFDPKTKTLHLTQRLVTQNVTDVQHFHDYYADKHYILLLQDGHPAKIYWFGNEQLLEWQDLSPFHGPASASFATLGKENIIAIVNQTEILLLVDNLSGHYTVNLTLQAQCSASTLPSIVSGLRTIDHHKLLNSHILSNIRSRGIKVEDVIFMNDPSHPDEKYILAYKCITDRGTNLRFDILEAEQVFLAESVTATDDLLYNIDELENILDSDQSTIDELEKVLAEDSIMLSDADQTWNCSISIEDSLIVEGVLSVDYLRLIAPQEQDDVTLENLAAQIETLQSNIDALEETSEGLLYTSRNPVVNVPIFLNSLDTKLIHLPEEPSLTKLNGISIQDLESSYLRKNKNQTVDALVEFDELTVDSLRLISPERSAPDEPGFINGIQTKDLLRKSVEGQVVTGHHTFTNVITHGNLTNLDSTNSPIFINGLSTADIVMKGTSEVIFSASKTFNSTFHAGSLQVSELMGVNFDDWVNSLIRTNSTIPQTLTGKVIIKGDLYVKENVEVTSVNNVNLKELEENTVKTTGSSQVVEGPVTFIEEVSISGNMNFSSINNIRWNDIIDSTSDQIIVSKFIVEEAVVSENLHSDNINGLDLSSEAVLQGVDQVIEGRTHFTGDVLVRGSEGVTMDKQSRINGVDPSELRGLLSNVGHVFIEEEFHYEQNLSFNCNINIDVLNGVLVDHLPTNYWRKNLSQTIPVDVTLKEAVFNAPLKIRSLNDLAVDQYLLMNREQTITGDYTFSAGLSIHADLTMSPQTTIDGVDLLTIREDVITLDTEQIIAGENHFRGGLSIEQLALGNDGLINSVSLNSVALLNKTNYFLGNVDFQSPVHADLFIPAGNIVTGTINDAVLEVEKVEIVKIDEAATIQGNLIFTAPVDVYDLSTKGNIDGVDLADLQNTTLKRVSSVPQNVTGDLIIYGNAFFNVSPTVEKINDEDFSHLLESTVTHDFDDVIKGRKKFLNKVFIINGASIKDYNGNDLDLTLSSILTRSSDQNITGDCTFANVRAEKLLAPIINGQSLDDVLLTNEFVDNSMDINFAGGVLVLELNSPSDIISGCDIKHLEDHMNWRDFNTHLIKEPLTIERLRITNDVVSPYGRIILNSIPGNEGTDFQDYIDSFVTKSGDQIITGDVTFVNNVTIVDMDTPFINLVDIDEVVHNSMRRSDEIINCPVNFTNTVLVHSLHVKGDLTHSDGVVIDGVHFKNLSENSVRKSQLSEKEILGKKTFAVALVVVGDFTVDSFNGSPVDDLVKMGPDEIVDSEVIFENGMDIKGHLTVGGLLDGVSLDDALNNRIPLDNATLDTRVTFEHLDIEGDLLTSTINDVQLSDLVLTGRNTTQLLTGDITFAGGLTIDGDLEVLESLNGMDVTEMSNRIAMTNRDELIQEEVVFKGEVFAPNVSVLGGRLATLDFHALHSDMVSLNKTVQDDMSVLQDLQAALARTNKENLARVRALRPRLDYLLESAVFEEIANTTTSLSPAANNTLLMGLLPKPCDGPRAACYCRRATHSVQVTGSGQLSPARPAPGVMELKNVPFSHNLLLELHTTCLDTEPSTTFTFIDEATGRRSLPQTLPLDYVIKSELLTPQGETLLAVISHQTGSQSLLSILKVDSTEGAERLSYADYVLLSQDLSDLCVLEVDGRWSVMVTGRRRPNTDGHQTKSYRYEWDQTEQKLVLKDIFPGYGVSSCLMFSAPRPRTNFLLLAQEDLGRSERDHLNASVLVFRQSPLSPDWERYESLNLQGVVDLTNITIGDQLLVAMVTRAGILYIYQLHYAESFEVIERVRLPLADPIGVAWVGPSIIYEAGTRTRQTAVQDSKEHWNKVFTAHDTVSSRSRNPPLYNTSENRSSEVGSRSGNPLLHSPNKDQGSAKTVAGLDIQEPDANGGYSVEDNSRVFHFKPNGNEVDSQQPLHGDGVSRDLRIENSVGRADYGVEVVQPRFIVGQDTLFNPTKGFVQSENHEQDQHGSANVIHAESTGERNPASPNLNFVVKNSSSFDQNVDFVTTVSPDELKSEAVLNGWIGEKNSRRNNNATSTAKKTESEDGFESLVYGKDFGDGSIDWNRDSTLQPDLLRSKRGVSAASVAAAGSIVENPSFLAVGSNSGLVLYEIRTAGIDGARLLAETRLLEE